MITTANKIRGTKVIKLASERTSFPRRTSKVESELVDSTTLALAEQHDFIFVPEFSQLSDEEGLPELASDSEIATRDPTKLDRSTPTHLVRLCEAKLLSPELERQLFRRMNFAKYRAWSLARNPKRSKNSGSLAQIKQFNQHALDDRNRIVSANLRLVVSCVFLLNFASS